MKKAITITTLVLLCHCVFAQDADLQNISTLIAQQQNAWNKGDLEGFMQSYWHSDSLMFIGKSGVKQGWKTTLINYKKNYPNASAMGQLTLTLLKLDKLSDTAVFVVGKWALKRNVGDIGGHFTLLWKKINGSWVIVTDHSS